MDCVHTTTKICRFNLGAALRLSLYFGNSPQYRASRSVADYRASFADQVRFRPDHQGRTSPSDPAVVQQSIDLSDGNRAADHGQPAQCRQKHRSRSRIGKQRARGNAYQHGLTTGLIPSAAFARKIERLARKIAGNTKDEIILGHARSAACAEFDLARVRRVRVALIERAYAIGTLGTSRLFNSARDAERFLDAIVRGKSLPNSVDPSATIPADKFERTAQVIRQVLPELFKLDRYESRAVARRDRAIRQIVRKRKGPPRSGEVELYA